MNRKSPLMGLNELSKRGDPVGKKRERKSPAPSRHGLLALVNATKRYRGERGEYQGLGTTGNPTATPMQNQLYDFWGL